MTRQKIIVIVGVPLVSLLLMGGGFALGHNKLGDKKLNNIEQASSSVAGSTSSSVPLNQARGVADSPSGLSVSGSGASSLGQLGDKSTGTQGSGSSGGSSSPSSNAPDSKTFADYEKYKDQQHALFGEIVKGTGEELTPNRKAAVYYKGWLTNGQIFDQSQVNSSGQKQPLIFTLGAHEVVPGMEEGVLGMKVGGKRLVLIPPAVGYGAAGNGPVPANALMVFEVELVTVQ